MYMAMFERFLYDIRPPTQNQLTQVTYPAKRPPPLKHTLQRHRDHVHPCDISHRLPYCWE